VDALERNLCQFVGANWDGEPDGAIFLTLAPGSPTPNLLAASPADVFTVAPLSIVYTASQLRLETADDVDALMCAAEMGITPPPKGLQVHLPLIVRNE
jgi:hypothetical protein